jgi:hypothetical protein
MLTALWEYGRYPLDVDRLTSDRSPPEYRL